MHIDKKRLKELKRLNDKTGIDFGNMDVLNTAFIHPSFTNEHGLESHENNQRLEFLGDAILDLAISQFLYENYPRLTEGQMTKIRASVVCEQSLSRIAEELSLGDYLILGRGEENTKGRHKPSILADTFEAFIGAIYLEKGFDVVQTFILNNLNKLIKVAVEGEDDRDYKTTLQELLQKLANDRVIYNVIGERGPDHDKIFLVEVRWKGKFLGKGTGKSKKEAEQAAAGEALQFLNND
jgi:ribonuclease-3